LGDLLISVAEQAREGYLTAGPLRIVGRELIAVAGDLTKLGAEMARWADELDRGESKRNLALTQRGNGIWRSSRDQGKVFVFGEVFEVLDVECG
jgi:hypothetical protein